MNEQTTEQTTEQAAPVMIYAAGHKLDGDALRRWTAAVLDKTHGRRSAWSRGVRAYADELISQLEDRAEFKDTYNPRGIYALMLNGAWNFQEYSEGASSLIYDEEIAARLSSPSEMKKLHRKDGSLRDPNPRENWIKTQGRALFQAAQAIKEAWDARAIKTGDRH